MVPAALLAQSNAPSSADGFDPNVNGIVYALAVQTDGKILVGGNFTTLQPNGTGVSITRNSIARLNLDGSLDTSFNPNVSGQINAMVVQTDGKIVIGGLFTAAGGSPRSSIARLNADGSLDSAFNYTFVNSGSVISPGINALALQTDGKILAGGAFTALIPAGSASATLRNRVARFNTDGSLDANFNPNANATVYSLAVQFDGKILMGGLFTTLQPLGASALTTRNHIARLNVDGTLDIGFDPNANANVTVLTVQPDGGILIGGFFTGLSPNGSATATTRNRMARLNLDGSLDTVFDPNLGSNPVAIALQPNGGILVGGVFNVVGGASLSYCVRLAPTGLNDVLFDAGANGVVNAIALQSDGNIIIGGNFSQLKPLQAAAPALRNHVARLNSSDGSTDVNFDPSTAGRVVALAIQPDGKVISGGVFTSVGGVSRNNIARSNPDGTLDGTFDPNINGTVSVLTLQSDGKILVGGTFSTVGGVTTRNNIARLNPDGTLDQAFDPNANDAVTAIAVQPDGKILIGGNFAGLQPDGSATVTATTTLARLNADGTIDTTFSVSFNGNVLALLLLSDGRIIAGGNFIPLNPNGPSFVAQNYIVRLTSTGGVDTTYSPNPNNRVESMVMQGNGQIVISGLFTTLNPNATSTSVATVRNHIARINANGTLDTTFDPNANNDVRTLALQADGKIVIGGIFTTLMPNGATVPVTQNYLARINTDGTVDSSFSALPNAAVNALVIQPDARILVGGAFTFMQQIGNSVVTQRNHLARLNTDSTLDTTYDPAFSNLAGTVVSTLAVQADGKILLGGSFANIGGEASDNFIRFNADGSLDTSFIPEVDGPVNAIAVQTTNGATLTQGYGLASLTSTGFPRSTFVPSINAQIIGQVFAVATQADGSILIGGSFTNLSGATTNNLVRFSANGTLDTSFNPVPDGPVSSIVVQSDGKIVFGGTFDTVDYVARNNIARVNSDGTLDTSYDPNSNGSVNTLLLKSDGTLLVGGGFTSLTPNGSTTVIARSFLAHLNADATVDPNFNPMINGTINALALQADGRMLLGGSFTLVQNVISNYVARLNTDGTLDLTFSPDPNSAVATIAVQPDGSILLGGDFTTVGGWSRNYITRLFVNGGNDPGFDPSSNGPVSSILLQPNNQILVAGHFTSIASTTRNNVARLNTDGTIDTSFDPNVNDEVDALVLQPDGGILIGGIFNGFQPYGVIMVGGNFSHARGVPLNNLVLFNQDGNANGAFQPNPNAPVNAILVQPDGHVLVGGAFTSIAGVTRNSLARFNQDGTFDATYNPNVGGQVNVLTLQADGRVLVGGQFTSVGGVPCNRLARLNADGSLDSTFNPGANGTISSITVQADGRVLVGGAFTNIGGVASSGLARLSASGAVDGSFSPNPNGAVNALALQSDGRILVGGAFTTIAGAARNYIARINVDGSVDTTFDPSADNVVSALSLQFDGKPVVGGAFARIGGQARYRFARLSTTTPATQSITLASDQTTLTWTRSGSGPELAWVTFEQSPDNASWTAIGQASRVGTTSNWQFTGAALPANAVYFVRARGSLLASQYSSSGFIESVREFFPRPVIANSTFSSNIGSFFYFAITASNSAGSFSASGLPAGLSVDPLTGIISGAPTQAGTFNVTLSATNGAGTSNATLTLFVSSSPGNSGSTGPNLINVSTRASVSTGQPIFLGFVIYGTESKTVLLRGVGPGLSAFGVPGVLPVPHLLLYNSSGTLMLENDGWANSSTLAAVSASVGAFPLAVGSADDAAVVSLPPGGYTVQVVDGSGAGGIALAEVYDVSPGQTGARFGNMSARGPAVGSGNPLIAGIFINGTTPKHLLVRGVGPGLAAFGVGNALSDSLVGVYNSQGHLIAQNDNWSVPVTVDISQIASNATAIAAASIVAGAFALDPAGLDSAVIVTLPPGLYTVQVSGVNNTSGSALAELYELP